MQELSRKEVLIVIPVEMFDVKRCLASATLLTVAACVMHYTGQIAQHGTYTVNYEPIFIGLACFVGFVVASVGLFLVVQVSATENVESEFMLRVAAALVIAGAVNTLHYVGMFGITYTLRTSRKSALTASWPVLFSSNYMYLAASDLSIISLAVSIVMLVVSQHYATVLAYRLRLAYEKSMKILPDSIQEILEDVYDDCLAETAGDLASYIPELANADANKFGIALVDTQGNFYRVGDCDHFATIQSVSKTLLYAMALCDAGEARTDKKIGSEPSGRPFNEISIDDQNRAFNPLINTGALVAASLLKGDTAKARYHHFESLVRRCSCPTPNVKLNRAVYDSETKTNSQNQMITRELCDKGIIEDIGDNVEIRASRQDSSSVQFLYGDLGRAGAVALNAYTRICSMQTPPWKWPF